jgi:heme-degrading monooxygenase HmoA
LSLRIGNQKGLQNRGVHRTKWLLYQVLLRSSLEAPLNRSYDQLMLIYEVNVFVNEDRAQEYAEFLDHHIRDILKIKGFIKAELFSELIDSSTPTPEPKQAHFAIHYHVETEADLQNYFKHHAAAMRKDAIDRFGNSFSAKRRNLISIQKFN